VDTSIWDPGADDSSKVSAQDDTADHIGYSLIQRELAVGDDIELNIGGPIGTIDSGKFNTLSFADRFLGTPVLALAVRDTRWHINMTVIRNHTT
jgi:hypothetical protein